MHAAQRLEPTSRPRHNARLLLDRDTLPSRLDCRGIIITCPCISARSTVCCSPTHRYLATTALHSCTNLPVGSKETIKKMTPYIAGGSLGEPDECSLLHATDAFRPLPLQVARGHPGLSRRDEPPQPAAARLPGRGRHALGSRPSARPADHHRSCPYEPNDMHITCTAGMALEELAMP